MGHRSSNEVLIFSSCPVLNASVGPLLIDLQSIDLDDPLDAFSLVLNLHLATVGLKKKPHLARDTSTPVLGLQYQHPAH